LVHPALPSRSPLASFHPLQPHRSRFYGGAQLQFSPSQICRPSFLHNFDAPHQGLPHHPSYPSMSSQPCSSHHAPPRGLHVPACGFHAPTHASHALLCPPRAAARSSSTNLLPPYSLLQLLLNGLFCCSFYFPFIIIFLYFSLILLFVLLFVGSYHPAMMWFDLEEEIDVGGRHSAPFWFSVLALQLSFYSDGCFTRIEFFTEFLYNLHRLVRPWNRPGLFMVLFESLVITIACCSILLDRIHNLFLYLHYSFSFGLCCWGVLPFCFGFIVGELTPCSF
jgi:hypothetical protein